MARPGAAIHGIELSKRLIIDVSTLVRSEGQATGIVRVTRELARWAHDHRSDAVFAACGWKFEELLCLNADWADKVLSGVALVDTSSRPDRLRTTLRIRDYLPPGVARLLMWIQHPRRTLLLALERHRLTAASAAAAQRIRRLQKRLMSEKHRREFSDSAGAPRPIVPFDMAMGKPVELRRGDVMVLTGSDWGETNPKEYQRLKQQHGIRFVWLCYDTIALLYPQFFTTRVADTFREYARDMMPVADLVIVSAKAVEADLKKYCVAHQWPVPKTRVIPFGSNLTIGKTGRDLPPPVGLQPGRYALFVSTIEPRKGHRLLFEVWKRLLREGVPQAAGFKLVFVGRAGWRVDDLMDELNAHPSVGDSLLILKSIRDEELAALYQNAAFCLYPSIYEGYGLPIVEAFAYGKAVLASTGGALPEVVGDFSPRLDPTDELAWHDTIKLWIEQPARVAGFEEKIRAQFRHPTWDQAARTFFDTIDEALG